MVGVQSEGAFYRLKIGSVTIPGELSPICQPVSYILHQVSGITRLTTAS